MHNIGMCVLQSVYHTLHKAFRTALMALLLQRAPQVEALPGLNKRLIITAASMILRDPARHVG